jgi:hypothetical protein
VNADEVIDAHYEPAPLAVVDAESMPPALFNTTDPVEVVAQATRVANALMGVIESKKLYKQIGTKKHIYVEAWQTCGVMLGVTPVCEWSRAVDDGWEARVVVKNARGFVMGAAEAQCLKSEQSKRSWDGYALRSMAQTRATSKALRSVFGFVVVLAGYNATPVEEMPDEPAAPVPQPAATRVAQPDPKSAVIARAIAAGVIPAGAGIDELRAYCADKGVVATPVAVNAHLDALAAQKPAEAKETRNPGEVSVQQRALAMTLHKKLGHDDDFRAVMYDSRFGKSSFKQLSKEEVSALIDELQDAIAKVGGEA